MKRTFFLMLMLAFASLTFAQEAK
ncbi:hydroxyisourate hydrolase, partial [Riemerella anatipestifer]|nr:hydroxyisourate hydrolase [Riemerella anatipestifer]MDD1540332.1 hydroxyisourate hydrolase [Riemerella anatipestifer]